MAIVRHLLGAGDARLLDKVAPGVSKSRHRSLFMANTAGPLPGRPVGQ